MRISGQDLARALFSQKNSEDNPTVSADIPCTACIDERYYITGYTYPYCIYPVVFMNEHKLDQLILLYWFMSFHKRASEIYRTREAQKNHPIS